jgi:hypothetical protein
MSLFRKVIVSAVLLVAQNTYAADYSLDASTMAVGATAGENLIVKEGCLDPTKTTCAATEKAKWLAAPLTKVGMLDVGGSLQGDFEVNLTINVNDGSKGITLLTPDNKSIEYNIAWYAGSGGIFSTAALLPKGIGEGGSSKYKIDGWNGMPGFNNISLTVRQGVAKVYINGSESLLEPITFDKNTVFSRVLIKGISSSDRLSEVKVRGLQSANFCSATTTSSTTPATSTTNNSGTCTASYSSTTGALIIPCVAIPVTSPFGGVTQTLNYSVQLQQRTGSFAFDLDLNKVQQK